MRKKFNALAGLQLAATGIEAGSSYWFLEKYYLILIGDFNNLTKAESPVPPNSIQIYFLKNVGGRRQV